MDKPMLRITLYATVIYFTGGLLASAVAEPHPLLRDGTHFCGVDHYQPRWRPDSKGLDNRNYAARNLNVGQPRTVRMIYFLPNDRRYRAEVVQRMKNEIRRVQTFFADQMVAHGYGRRTFRVETDSQGELIVHRVDGRHPDSHYLEDTGGTVFPELESTFDFSKNVYLIVVDNSIDGVTMSDGELVAGFGERSGKQGGGAWVSELFSSDLVPHELGHAFGLGHDFRDETHLLSYGGYLDIWRGGSPRLSACHADFLSMHPYFNSDTPIEEGPPPQIELISPRSYPASAKSIPIRVKVNDSDGLHQVILHASQPDNRASVKACRELGGKQEAVITFDYDGVIPSAHDPPYSRSTSLLNPLVHPIRIEAVDMSGDVASSWYNLSPEIFQPLTKISGDNQHGLPNRPLPSPFVIEVWDLNEGYRLIDIPITFSVTGGGKLSVEHTQTNDYGRAESTLTLGPNLGTTTVTVSAAGIEGIVTFTAMAGAPVEIPDPNLRAAVETAIGVAPGTLIAPAEMVSLTEFEVQKANISDLTGLEYATNLKDLNLQDNNITDISALSGLTNLIILSLHDNTISDISALSGLTDLGSLSLSGNAISDISALSGLTNLGLLSLSGNAISNISAVSGLTHLRSLSLFGNSISDISLLAGLTDLRFLYLQDNAISDISALSGLTNLGLLSLSGNAITNISALSGLTNLIILSLHDNTISDISALSGLTDLGSLSLSGNAISDISPLVANTGLATKGGSIDWLGVNGNPLNYQSIHTHIPTLQSRGVLVEFDTRTVESLLKISGDSQQGTVGEVLTDPFVVEVVDGRGIAFAGVPVTFIVTDGSGTLSVTSTTTDENGRAASALTLGLDPGINTVLVSAGGWQVSFNAVSNPLTTEYTLSIPAGTSLIHVPLKVTAVDGVDQSIESISDLYAALGGASTVNFLITYDSQAQAFRTFFGVSDRGMSADVDLTDDTGVIAGLKTPVTVQLTGEALGIDGNSTVTLHRGLNLVGLPLNDSSITRVSDLFTLDGIRGNVPVVILTAGGDFQSVGRTGDPWDIPITGGQGFILTAQRAATVTISGEAWTNTSTTVGPHIAVNIPDPNLRAAIENALSKAPGTLIAPSEIATLPRLEAPNANITDLTGLEHATNLTTLNLGHVYVDGRPINSNSLSNISLLAGLTNLTELRLGFNLIENISPLAGLTNLTFLDITGNSVSNTAPIASLTKLTHLDLDGNPLLDISAVTGLTNLTFLDIWGTPISDISSVAHLTNLTVLGLGFNSISDLSPVVANSGLGRGDVVVVSGNPLSYTSINAHIPTLRRRGVVVHADNLKPATSEYALSIPAGMSLIHIPLKVTEVDGAARTIESISALYDALGGALTVNYLITYDSQAQTWRSYFSPADTGTPADQILTADMGILVSMLTPTSVGLAGEALGLGGSGSINLNQGLNCVGVPLRDKQLTRVSDLRVLDGISDNVPVIILIEGSDFKGVGRAGDPGDIEITGGQGFILTAQQPATATISGEAWTKEPATASPIAHRRIEVRDTTPVLALRGAVVDERTGAHADGFRVIAKNLSVGRTGSVVTAPDEAGYRLIFVDIETGRAATIGDTLAISAQSPDPFIGVKPLRYTVTAEDVRRSLIELPELVAYEIPRETELLANYPNPFNPETWIPYRLAEDAFVTLTIYDQTGQVVRTIDVGHQIAAVYESRSKAIYWDGRNEFGETVASGLYFYSLQAGEYSATKKMVILK